MERNMLIALIIVGVIVLLAINHRGRYFGYRDKSEMHRADAEEGFF